MTLISQFCLHIPNFFPSLYRPICNEDQTSGSLSQPHTACRYLSDTRKTWASSNCRCDPPTFTSCFSIHCRLFHKSTSSQLQLYEKSQKFFNTFKRKAKQSTDLCLHMCRIHSVQLRYALTHENTQQKVNSRILTTFIDLSKEQ